MAGGAIIEGRGDCESGNHSVTGGIRYCDMCVKLGGPPPFKRVQCAPDLLPNDPTGLSVYYQQTGAFEFRAGPVCARRVVLADEINRAAPRTQSALPEAIQERQVTTDGITHPLPESFPVLAPP